MKASCANWVAAGLILAGGAAVFGSTGAAAGLRPPVSSPSTVSVWRGDDLRAIAGARRRAGLYRRGQLNFFGAAGPTEGETPAAQEEEAPQAATPCPPTIPGFGRLAAESAGPRLIEIGGRAPSARRGPLPIVVYGDPWR